MSCSIEFSPTHHPPLPRDPWTGAAAGLQLEELAVSRTADVLDELGFTVDGAGFRCFLAVAKNAANGERWP